MLKPLPKWFILNCQFLPFGCWIRTEWENVLFSMLLEYLIAQMGKLFTFKTQKTWKNVVIHCTGDSPTFQAGQEANCLSCGSVKLCTRRLRLLGEPMKGFWEHSFFGLFLMPLVRTNKIVCSLEKGSTTVVPRGWLTHSLNLKVLTSDVWLAGLRTLHVEREAPGHMGEAPICQARNSGCGCKRQTFPEKYWDLRLEIESSWTESIRMISTWLYVATHRSDYSSHQSAKYLMDSWRLRTCISHKPPTLQWLQLQWQDPSKTASLLARSPWVFWHDSCTLSQDKKHWQKSQHKPGYHQEIGAMPALKPNVWICLDGIVLRNEARKPICLRAKLAGCILETNQHMRVHEMPWLHIFLGTWLSMAVPSFFGTCCCGL